MQNSEDKAHAVKNSPARTRGRPRAFDREAALAKATRLFWQKGYEATSVSELTEAMGINSPSLYAAFGSKEALYAEALRYYCENYESLVWANFFAARSAREAVQAFLLDSARSLTGNAGNIPCGCMITLSAVGSEGHVELGENVQTIRAVTFERMKSCLQQAVDKGELPAATNVSALARFVQSVQNGMSILARDGVSYDELEAMVQVTMAGWDARTRG